MSRIPSFRMVEEGIALVPEGRGVFTEMTVDENLWLGSNPARAREGTAARRDEVMALFPRLAERRRQRVGTMSGGEQQMVAIARALMSKPDLLLLDQPSFGLAPILVGELFAALERIRDAGVVPPPDSDTGLELCGQRHGVHLVASELCRRAVTVPLDQPMLVVGPPEVDEGETQLLDGAEGPDPEEVLLEGADEPLGAAVALGRPDEGGRGRGAEPGDLALEVV